jgi:hypothetical protein
MMASDRVFLALVATLFLLVLFIEWRKNRHVPEHVKPVPAGERLLERSNIPPCRDFADVVTVVAND